MKHRNITERGFPRVTDAGVTARPLSFRIA